MIYLVVGMGVMLMMLIRVGLAVSKIDVADVKNRERMKKEK